MVINGNNIDVLKQYPDNYFDSIVTDPPYGLGKEPNAEELMKDWINQGYHEISGSGFMGKEWDAFVPQPIFWKEVFRVLKHGGHVVAFYGTRTYDWGVMAMRFAGFEIRDCIQWLYGCLSDDTEILTKNGYIQYHKFIKIPNFEQQEILIYDSENDIYKWEKPERWNEYNIHKDTCYRIESDSTNQIVSRNHRCLIEREGELVFIEAEYLSKVEYMPTLSDDFLLLQNPEILQPSMQRVLSRSRMEETRTQRKGSVVRKNERKLSLISNGRKKSIMERRDNLSEKERILFGSQVEVCEMPKGVYSDGEEGWLRCGVSLDNGKAVEQTSIENGMRTSYRPQSNEQQHKQPNVICDKQGTQAIRTWRSYSTTLATVTPIEYSGVIFCPTVSTGAFVARRNGNIFLTGNSGFPKSHNISKAIDKLYGTEREVVGFIKEGHEPLKSGHTDKSGGGFIGEERSPELKITISASEEAKKWDGWGSALKPANEPIVLARKPLEKGLSIAENVLKYGTGGINIDGCRIVLSKGDDPRLGGNGSWKTDKAAENVYEGGYEGLNIESSPLGRFPANIILGCSCEDESNHEEDCPIKILDKQSGILKSGAIKKSYEYKNNGFSLGKPSGKTKQMHESSEGYASRFFYCAKASKSERNKGLDGFEEKETKYGSNGGGMPSGNSNPNKTTTANFHPTVKPVKLMQYLVCLITPPNGKVLDPFCGSGTTGIACKLEGVEFVGIEQDPEYTKIAEARISNWIEEKEIKKNKVNKKDADNKSSAYNLNLWETNHK